MVPGSDDRRRALDEADRVLARRRWRPEPLSLIEWLGVVVLVGWLVALAARELGGPLP